MSALSRDALLAKLPRVLDNSFLSEFRNCEHKGLWALVGLTPQGTSVDLHAGGAFAKALEVLYKSVWLEKKPLDLALASANVAFEKAWGAFVPNIETNKTKLNVWRAVLSYVDRFDPPNDYISPAPGFANPFEYRLAIPLTKEDFGLDIPRHPLYDEPFIYGGKFDMVGQQYGMLRIRDDKLTKQLGASWAKKWTLRSQFLGYTRCMQLLGHDVDTVEVRGTSILVRDINHETAVHTYTKAHLERWQAQIKIDVERLISAILSGTWAYNFDDQCAQYGGCKFLDLCRVNNAEDYFSSFGERAWNPLTD